MRNAKAQGYRVYFYFISTASPDINVDRVKVRVAKNGHPVPEHKIRDRYFKSLDLLYDAIKASDRAFMFDNSKKASELICEINGGTKGEMKTKNVPAWFMKYVYEKIR